jgi:hypothetical protein
MCEPYKSLKTISGRAKPSSNFFLQFSLNFFNLLQSTYCCKFLSPIFFFLLVPVFFFLLFSLNRFFSFEGIVSTWQPCRCNPRIEAKIPEPPGTKYSEYELGARHTSVQIFGLVLILCMRGIRVLVSALSYKYHRRLYGTLRLQ